MALFDDIGSVLCRLMAMKNKGAKLHTMPEPGKVFFAKIAEIFPVMLAACFNI
jgi:hypothetical protein